MPADTKSATPAKHSLWVRSTHGIMTLSFVALAFSGFIILMCHPRLYWGEVGNDLTPALLELPISRNHQHGGWEKSVPFFDAPDSPVSASRSYEIFNQNGWGRSLHFLAAWFLVVPGAVYLLYGIFSGHFWRHLVPKDHEWTWIKFWQEFRSHWQLQIRPGTGGPQYGLFQKCAYAGVVFVAFPLAVVTGLAMSPAITTAYPFLSGMFGGFQSARTVHFFASVVLVLFVLVHLAMILRSGFKPQIRGITLGE